MHRIERISIYAILALLAIAVVSRPSGLTPTAGADATAPEEVLGPVDRLVLDGPEGPVDVKAVGNGVGWGDSPYQRSWSMATVDVPKLVRSLMESDRFDEDRAELREEAEAQSLEFQERFEEFQEANAEVTPESPEFPEVQATYQAMMQEYQKWQQGTMAIQQKLGAEQIETAFKEMVEAIDIVAEEEKIDIVLRFVPVDQPFDAEMMDAANVQVQRRSILHYPDTIDITAKVEQELGL